MTLNIVDYVILAILGLSLVAGMYRGFLASGLTTAGFVAAFFGAQALYPQLSTAIQSNQGLMDTLTYIWTPPPCSLPPIWRSGRWWAPPRTGCWLRRWQT